MLSFSLDKKISILISIPLIAFILLSTVFISKNWQSYRKAQEAQIVTELLSSTTQLVRSLQVERSDLGLLLIGVLNQDKIKIKRQEDEKIINHFIDLNLKAKNFLEIPKEISEMNLELKNIQDEADKNLTFDTFEKYNLLISNLFKFEIYLVKENSIASIHSNLLAIVLLDQSRESGSQLQTMLLPILLANSPLSVTNIAKMDKLYRGVISNLESPLLDVSVEVIKKLEGFQVSEDWQMITMIYNSIMAKSGEGQYGINLEGFNDVMNKTLSLLDEPSQLILNEVSDQVKNVTNKSIHDTIFMSLLIIFITIIIFIVVRLFTKTLSKQFDMIAKLLNQNAEAVATTANKIQNSSEELSQSSQEQSNSLEQTTQAIDEMNHMVQKNSDNASKTAKSSLSSKSKADSSRVIVEEMLQSMNEINLSNEEIMNQIHQSNQQMQEIVKVISEIGDKTKVINDIVFQTKLLSFNASVESERAGIHGKGFAVVAEEVGRLAEMSGRSAHEISQILAQGTQKVEDIVRDTQQKVEGLVQVGRQKVNSGLEVVQKCASSLDEIIENVTSVSVMADEISQASREQSQRVSEVTQSVKELDLATQKNSSIGRVVSDAAEMLSIQSKTMKEAVLELEIIVEGRK